MQIEVKLTDHQLPLLASLIAAELRGSATYSKKEAAEKLGVSEKTIQRRVDAKLIPRVPNLNNVRIPCSFIDKLVNPNLGA